MGVTEGNRLSHREVQGAFFEFSRKAGIDVLLSPVVGHLTVLPLQPPHAFNNMLSFASLANLLGILTGFLPSDLHVEQNDLEKLGHTCAGSLVIPDAVDKDEAAYYDDYGSRSPTHYYQFPVSPAALGRCVLYICLQECVNLFLRIKEYTGTLNRAMDIHPAFQVVRRWLESV
ncbi:unnamed protein product [Dibothriocephalus latus]|uniref:Uncharacterized protein n=1 Tax=Dibothriocephalus latus TaxID=60516 RepID=A0A3P7NKU3_DIBLA|nr:unnamed protein product [Dibothriocephalus latus]